MTTKRELEFMADRIEAVLSSHRVRARVTGGTVTPRWVRFEVLPAVGARISRIKGLHEELASALDAPDCRVSRQGATVAIEIPRADPQPVRLLSLLRQINLDVVPPATATLGLAEDGSPLLIRLPSPNVAHVLTAGTTGSGKTVLLQAMILSLAMANTPPSSPRAGEGRELAMVLIDPKGHAFSIFAGLPHLVRPVIHDASEATEALLSLVRLMEKRGRGHNRSSTPPPVIVVIDELADLLMVSGKPAQQALTRLTQRGREAGIHIVAATQKPTAAVLGPLVKANFPVRLVGRVTSIEDARTATGWSGTGAERLTGQGDFLAVAKGRVIHFQSAYISHDEIAEVMEELYGLPAVIPQAAVADELTEQPSPAITMPPSTLPPATPPVDEVTTMIDRLRKAGWDPGGSYRSACRALGEAEGGRRFALVCQAVDRLRGEL